MKRLFFLLFVLSLAATAFPQDYAGFRGPGSQGIYPESNLMKKWPEQGPDLIMKVSGFGAGYSQPVVYRNNIYVSGTKDSLNLVTAYTIEGKQLWQTHYGKFWIRTYPENRCTPSVEGDRLYIASGVGELCCLDTKTGSILWKVHAADTYKAEIHKHGEAESLLLTEKAVIYTTGGEENAVIALKKEDGSLIWKSKSLGGSKSYASPILISKGGMQIILAQTAKHLIALNARNGDILWSYDLMQYHLSDQGIGANTNPPLVHGDEIFVTSGYNHPGLMFSLSQDGLSASLKWRNDTLDCHVGGVVRVGNAIYGSNWQNNAKGKWACLDWETGKLNWEKEWYNKGSLISADGMLYLYEEKSGHVALVEPDEKQMKIKGSFNVTEGTGPHWAHPAIYNGRLYIRHGNHLLVYALRSEK